MTIQAVPFSTTGLAGVRTATPAGRWVRSLREMAGQALRYSVVGTTGTAVYVGLYLLLDMWVQPVIGNAAAWLVTTVATNSVQRRFAFGVADREHHRIDQIVGLASSGMALLISTLVLAALTDASDAGQVLALVMVNVLVGTARFLTVRWWFGHGVRTA